MQNTQNEALRTGLLRAIDTYQRNHPKRSNSSHRQTDALIKSNNWTAGGISLFSLLSLMKSAFEQIKLLLANTSTQVKWTFFYGANDLPVHLSEKHALFENHVNQNVHCITSPRADHVSFLLGERSGHETRRIANTAAESSDCTTKFSVC